jgi:hypothetical protein
MTSKLIELIEKANDSVSCSFFGQPHERFRDSNCNQITISTKKLFECNATLIDCLDKKFFENSLLIKKFDIFIQNNSCQTVTYVNFESFVEQSNLQIVIEQLLIESEELKKQTDTVVFKIPTQTNLPFGLRHSFLKSYFSYNIKNEKFLIVTNNKCLIKLHEKV